jgi:hypothetical protein
MFAWQLIPEARRSHYGILTVRPPFKQPRVRKLIGEERIAESALMGTKLPLSLKPPLLTEGTAVSVLCGLPTSRHREGQKRLAVNRDSAWIRLHTGLHERVVFVLMLPEWRISSCTQTFAGREKCTSVPETGGKKRVNQTTEACWSRMCRHRSHCQCRTAGYLSWTPKMGQLAKVEPCP